MSITNFLEKVPAKLQEVYDEKLSAYITEEYNVHMLYLEEIYPVIFQQIQERAIIKENNVAAEIKESRTPQILLPKTPSHNKRQRPRFNKTSSPSPTDSGGETPPTACNRDRSSLLATALKKSTKVSPLQAPSMTYFSEHHSPTSTPLNDQNSCNCVNESVTSCSTQETSDDSKGLLKVSIENGVQANESSDLDKNKRENSSRTTRSRNKRQLKRGKRHYQTNRPVAKDSSRHDVNDSKNVSDNENRTTSREYRSVQSRSSSVAMKNEKHLNDSFKTRGSSYTGTSEASECESENLESVQKPVRRKNPSRNARPARKKGTKRHKPKEGDIRGSKGWRDSTTSIDETNTSAMSLPDELNDKPTGNENFIERNSLEPRPSEVQTINSNTLDEAKTDSQSQNLRDTISSSKASPNPLATNDRCGNTADKLFDNERSGQKTSFTQQASATNTSQSIRNTPHYTKQSPLASDRSNEEINDIDSEKVCNDAAVVSSNCPSSPKQAGIKLKKAFMCEQDDNTHHRRSCSNLLTEVSDGNFTFADKSERIVSPSDNKIDYTSSVVTPRQSQHTNESQIVAHNLAAMTPSVVKRTGQFTPIATMSRSRLNTKRTSFRNLEKMGAVKERLKTLQRPTGTKSMRKPNQSLLSVTSARNRKAALQGALSELTECSHFPPPTQTLILSETDSDGRKDFLCFRTSREHQHFGNDSASKHKPVLTSENAGTIPNESTHLEILTGNRSDFLSDTSEKSITSSSMLDSTTYSTINSVASSGINVSDCVTSVSDSLTTVSNTAFTSKTTTEGNTDYTSAFQDKTRQQNSIGNDNSNFYNNPSSDFSSDTEIWKTASVGLASVHTPTEQSPVSTVLSNSKYLPSQENTQNSSTCEIPSSLGLTQQETAVLKESFESNSELRLSHQTMPNSSCETDESKELTKYTPGTFLEEAKKWLTAFGSNYPFHREDSSCCVVPDATNTSSCQIDDQCTTESSDVSDSVKSPFTRGNFQTSHLRTNGDVKNSGKRKSGSDDDDDDAGLSDETSCSSTSSVKRGKISALQPSKVLTNIVRPSQSNRLLGNVIGKGTSSFIKPKIQKVAQKQKAPIKAVIQAKKAKEAQEKLEREREERKRANDAKRKAQKDAQEEKSATENRRQRLEVQRAEDMNKQRKEKQEQDLHAAEEEKRRRLQKNMQQQREVLMEKKKLKEERDRVRLRELQNLGSTTSQIRSPIQSRPEDNYDITGIRSDDETDDENDPRQPVPLWARNDKLKAALIQQHHSGINPFIIFPPNDFSPIKLRHLFPNQTKPRYDKRTSSALWENSPRNPGSLRRLI